MEEDNKNVEEVQTPVEPVEAPVEQAPETPQVMESAVVPEKKKGKGGLIFLLLLLVIGGGFAAWYFAFGGKDVLAGKKEEPKQEEKKEEKKEKKKEDEKKEESKIVELKEEDVQIYKELIDLVLYEKYDADSLDISKTDNNLILNYAMAYLKNPESISKQELNNTIKKLFGDVKYTDEDVKCKCTISDAPLMKYDAEKEMYTNTHSHSHGTNYFKMYRYFQNAEKNETDGTLTISYKIVYGVHVQDVAGPSNDLYLNAKDSKNNTNQVYTKPDGEDPLTGEALEKKVTEVYEANKEKFPVTTFYFEKDSSGNYGFKKVETK